MRSLTFITASVLIAVSCSQSCAGLLTNASLGQSASRSGWVPVSNSGFTISLPPDMKVKILSKDDENNLADRASKRHPGDQKAMTALKTDAAKGRLKFVATLKKASATGFHNALAVLVEPNTGSKTEDELLKSNMKSLEKTSEPGSVLGSKIHLPCGSAIRIQSNKLRPGAATSAATTYLMIHANQLYVFSFVSHLDDKEVWRTTASSAMESLKFDH